MNTDIKNQTTSSAHSNYEPEIPFNATLSGKTYIILSDLNPNYVLEVNNNGINDGTTVQLNLNRNSSNQYFHFKWDSYDWVKIIGVNSNKVISLGSNKRKGKEGIQILNYDSYLNSNQLFCFVPAGNGYYIHCKNGKYLEASQGQGKNTIELKAADYSGKANQKWRLVQVPNPEYAQVPDGIYSFYSYVSSNLVAAVMKDPTTNHFSIVTHESNGDDSQKFKVIENKTNKDDLFYYLINSKKAMELFGSRVKNKVTLTLSPLNYSPAQQFRFKPTLDGDGAFFIEYGSTNYVWDVPKGEPAVFESLILYKLKEKYNENQRWRLSLINRDLVELRLYYI